MKEYVRFVYNPRYDAVFRKKKKKKKKKKENLLTKEQTCKEAIAVSLSLSFFSCSFIRNGFGSKMNLIIIHKNNI
ncbi:hypothetical protein HanRHA438_Chr12g0537831 [Helianthus annuus]|nr:hypothetical protein HanRHA438_Chr12g0537831 [Helianthus annuus]